MLLHKKIRFLRLNKGWSQETMAEKLDISSNGYGSIERGETNLQISRVLQIAKLFEVEVSDLFRMQEGKNVFNSMGSNNTEIQNNNASRCYFGASDGNYGETECQHERQELELNVEKQITLIEKQNNEIVLLKQINELLMAAKLTPPPRTFQRRSDSRVKEEPRIDAQRRKETVSQSNSNLAHC